MTNHYLACGAFDCLLSDSPCQCFSWFIGKWREFRPSSSWVFGSWEAANSGTAEGTENADRQNWKDHFDSGVCMNHSAKSFFVRHTLVCPKPSRNPPNTSFCKHLPRQEIERLHTNITNFTNQHHLMRCSSSHFLPRSITVIGVCSSLESSDSR